MLEDVLMRGAEQPALGGARGGATSPGRGTIEHLNTKQHQTSPQQREKKRKEEKTKTFKNKN